MQPLVFYEISKRILTQKTTKHIADKKFGFFQQDVDTFKEMPLLNWDWKPMGNMEGM